MDDDIDDDIDDNAYDDNDGVAYCYHSYYL